jgi:hypothetical protein
LLVPENWSFDKKKNFWEFSYQNFKGILSNKDLNGISATTFIDHIKAFTE